MDFVGGCEFDGWEIRVVMKIIDLVLVTVFEGREWII